MQKIFVGDQMEDILSDPEYLRPPRKLFGSWFHENEIGLLMGDTNVGKTVLANDIAFANDCGCNFWRGTMCEAAGEKNIVFYDLENSKQQFAARYVNKGFVLNNITRVELNQRNVGLLSGEEFLEDMESRIDSLHQNLFIVDNLSYLLNCASAKESIVFMKQLKSLKEMNPNVSILLVAHTKKRSMAKPLDQNDLYGSKFLMNFVDSAFALGASVKDSSTRYLKQIKTRNSEKYNLVAELEMEGSPYLHLELVDWTPEEEHLKPSRSREKVIVGALAERILELAEEGYSLREIAKETGISKSSIQRFLNEN